MQGFNPSDTHSSTTFFSIVEGVCICCIDRDTVRDLISTSRSPVVLLCATEAKAVEVKGEYDQVMCVRVYVCVRVCVCMPVPVELCACVCFVIDCVLDSRIHISS